MDIEAALSFAREHHRAVFATRRSDGSIQMSPVTVSVDAENRLVVSSREAAAKTHNVRRHPEVSACVFTERFFGEWIQIDGSAEVIPLPEAMEGLVQYYRTIAGEHEDWDAYRQAMRGERRVLIAVTVTRAGPDRSG